ncbi:hypothetical protein [Legionella drancourtii]|uniref:Uncharacterized protein n=1 Tax=Legionella drancourtii LLAP12 TaxID=658187 RepID=G9EQU5_9GAMM|nr:hypothetical protein [Legionella drancourtii]EHL30316.1 hypothetical protein LDG_7648 [Legionella drancourtii LLAP12]
MFEKISFTAELELKFFAQEEFEPVSGLCISEQAPILTRNLLRVLMMGWTESWKELLTFDVIHAVFIARNPLFLKEMRRAFQDGFEEIFKQLDGHYLNEEQSEQVQLYLSNCLSLLPYSDLTAYESIKVPQCIDGVWELVEYQVKPIELTKGDERDVDRVFAYGLEPLFQRKAESHFIFMGTTYPAGQGFLTQINANTKGFESVGESLYRTGRARIQAWLEQQENKIHVCGTSLGGSLSLLLAIDKGNYQLSRVDALNPPGLHNAHFKSQFDHWDELLNKPKVVVQKQGDDPVSFFGVWASDWQILQVNPPAAKRGPNGVLDHGLNYAGLKGTCFTYVDAKEDNNKRDTRNFWVFSLGRSLIYYGLIAPYTYIVRPVGYFLAKNWPLLVPLIPTIGLAIYLAGMGALTGFPAVALFVTLGLITSLLLYKSFQTNPTTAYVEMHNPRLPRNQHMDIYDHAHAVKIELTYQQINTYYRVMRCLVKGKAFLPSEQCPSKCTTGITKKELLIASENAENADEVIPLQITKAKVGLIRHTLLLTHKIIGDNQEELKQALEDNYREYCLGKLK